MLLPKSKSFWCCCAVGAAALLTIGCEAAAPTAAPPRDESPTARFARFEKELNRLCLESNGLLQSGATGGLGVTTVQTVIDPPSCILHEPTTPDGKYTAEVTIVTRLLYSSVVPAPTTPTSKATIKPPPPANTGLLGSKEEEKEEPPPETAGKSLMRREEFRDTYDLVDDGQWRLATREMPDSTRLLFERALRAQ